MFFQRRYASGQEAHEKKLKITDGSGHANPPIFHFMSFRVAVTNKHKSVGKKMEKLECLCIADENAKGTGPMGSSMAAPRHSKGRSTVAGTSSCSHGSKPKVFKMGI